MTDHDDHRAPDGHRVLGRLTLPTLVYLEVLDAAEARGVAPLDVVADVLAAWALGRRQGRPEQGRAPEEEPER